MNLWRVWVTGPDGLCGGSRLNFLFLWVRHVLGSGRCEGFCGAGICWVAFEPRKRVGAWKMRCLSRGVVVRGGPDLRALGVYPGNRDVAGERG